MPLLNVVAALTITAVGSSSNYLHQNTVPDRVLATPRITPDMNGVLWHARSPGQRDHLNPGPADYGAPPEAACDLVFVRVDHIVVSISPWERFTAQGHQRLERARNLWLREHGYVGGVRTHVNAAHQAQSDEHAQAPAPDDIKPRAVLHIRERIPANNAPTRAMAAPHPVFKVVPGTTEIARADATGDAG